jgi:hypothetical protein
LLHVVATVGLTTLELVLFFSALLFIFFLALILRSLGVFLVMLVVDWHWRHVWPLLELARDWVDQV